MGHAVGRQWGSLLLGALAWAALAAACADPATSASAPSPKPTSTVVTPTDACSAWQKSAAYPAAPEVAKVGAVLPSRILTRAVVEGVGGAPIPPAQVYAPCATRPELLVVRVHGGAWCGTCAWHATHTNELFDFDEAKDAMLVDVVVGDRSNHPATKEAAIAFADAFRTSTRAATVADPDFSLRSLLPPGGGASPLYVVVDRHSMVVLGTLSNPDAVTFRNGVRELLGHARRESESLVDGVFHANEWDLLSEMRVPGAPKPDPTNRVADDAKAAAFGKELFNDKDISPSGTVACATCHDPAKHFSDELPLGVGLKTGGRRTPAIALAAHSPFQFWDGRTDTLWAQALGPLENEAEHGSSRVFVVRRIASHYGATYNQVFATDPLPDPNTLPPDGKPGDAAYDNLPQQTKLAVTRVFVNVGKAIEAYERTLRVKGNRFDAYMAGDRSALTILEKEGLSMFMQQGCAQCHWGPRWTDDAFHNVRLPGRTEGPIDEGRLAGVKLFANAEFSSRSALWSDAPSTATFPQVGAPSELGAYKTPSLRGIADQPFFGHAGGSHDLRSVLEIYGTAGLAADDPRATGIADPWLVQFGFTAQWGIPQFLSVMTADIDTP
ncbi:MAG: cytochrome c peroxidase [Polyangiaceae bacterium]